MIRLSRSLAVLVAAALAWSCGAPAEQPFRIGSNVSGMSTGIKGVIAPWIETVARENPGFAYRAFWGGTLGKDAYKQYDLVKAGVLDAGWVLPDYTAGQFPELGLFGLPFLFENAEEAAIVGWELYDRGLLTGFDDVALVGFFSTEPNTLFLAEPIASLDALRGRKIRALGPIQAHWLESYGASPQALSAVDMNQALAKNALDGAIQGWTGMQTFNSFPLVEQAYAVPVGVTPFLLVVNRDSLARLPRGVQDSMAAHGGLEIARTGAAQYGGAGEEIAATMRAAEDFAVVAPTAQEEARYRAEAEEIHRWWIARTPNGAAVYAEAQAILAELRGTAR